MFYWGLRAAVGWLMRLFFRLEPVAGHASALTLPGSVIFVANHPNALVDPGLLFSLIERRVTFLAKAPLFSIPVLGAMLRAMGAMPVFRKQDGASDMKGNDATLDAAVKTLVQGGALMLFPEGKSHSEPQLSALKTGCARIAFEAFLQGAQVAVVPVGLTYAEKSRFRSGVHVEVGAPLRVADAAPEPNEDSGPKVRAFTQSIADALRGVTLNLESWEDLPLLKTAEALYALKAGEAHGDPVRLRAFSKGMALLRQEQPAKFALLKSETLGYLRALNLLEAAPGEVAARAGAVDVARFIARNLAALLFGFPLFALGMVVFFIPYLLPGWVARAVKADHDSESTYKVLTAFVLGPAWLSMLTAVGYAVNDVSGAVVAGSATLPLALFTRYFYERRREAVADALTFLRLRSRAKLREQVRADGEALAAQIEAIAVEIGPRV